MGALLEKELNVLKLMQCVLEIVINLGKNVMLHRLDSGMIK